MLMLPEIDEQGGAVLNKLSFFDNSNEILSIFGLSCHPVFSTSKIISSDYPGEIVNHYQNTNESSAIFLQGWSGDLRPDTSGKFMSTRSLIDCAKALFNGKVFLQPDFKKFSCFCNDIVNLIQSIKPLHVNDQPLISSLQRKLSLVSSTGHTTKSFFVSIHRIDNILFISIPAEVSSRYYSYLASNFVSYKIFPLGCSNGMIGYLPYYDQVREKGYEVDSAKNYGWDSYIGEDSLIKFKNDLYILVKDFVDD
ncbi:hypothetical protein [Nitrincola sp. A-D6]|uniref:hypothetical protein n=1 Tax=Nitrincola sp. A-D6 TaxID=1545442 RepID=UPI00056D0FAF|nr:hypothetical protein [Nitrincola sp. A-D6]